MSKTISCIYFLYMCVSKSVHKHRMIIKRSRTLEGGIWGEFGGESDVDVVFMYEFPKIKHQKQQ